ncbi:MAG: glutamate 5-kinase [Proteobacteria bacterium]|nr:glutamate 5-kinase [Pseudomonadota bacterium]
MKLTDYRSIVIKIGSSLLTDEKGNPRRAWLENLLLDVAELKKQKSKNGKPVEVVIVSSGAVALGRNALGFAHGALRLEEKQAAAACGQPRLMALYRELFEAHKIHAAQVLLTMEDSEDRRRYLNARTTLRTLLDAGVVPVINENDTVATEELRFGDNDRLAARVAQMVSAELLILLSDIDGLYTANPKTDKNAKHIPLVKSITPEIEAMGGAAISAVGSGGMVTKIAAAKMAFYSGCHTVIMEGSDGSPLKRLEKGGVHTLFQAQSSPMQARKHWIASGLRASGEVTVDSGAAKALKEGKSLLPAGVKEIKGQFGRGDAVSILDESGREIGRGLVAYAAEDARRIIGHKSAEIAAILGYEGRDALIHRDDMVVS